MLGLSRIKNSYSFEPVEISGKPTGVNVVESDIKNGYAILSDGVIIIKVPRRCAPRRKLEIANDLYKKISAALQKNPARFFRNKELEFYDGEIISPFGVTLAIRVLKSERKTASCSIRNGVLAVKAPTHADEILISKCVSNCLRKELASQARKLVEDINSLHFGSALGKVRLNSSLSVWGSCSPKNDITLNLRLFFIDRKFLEYVIVHELAHTHVRSHSKRFWREVERVIPDYRILRKGLKSSGTVIKTEYQSEVAPTEKEAAIPDSGENAGAVTSSHP